MPFCPIMAIFIRRDVAPTFAPVGASVGKLQHLFVFTQHSFVSKNNQKIYHKDVYLSMDININRIKTKRRDVALQRPYLLNSTLNFLFKTILEETLHNPPPFRVLLPWRHGVNLL